jgi:predicted amidophosphoribosyltransferase
MVYRAKSYGEKPGDPKAAEELCELFVEQIRRHPTIQRADGILGVPANPPKSPHNLPELMAERASSVLGVPLETRLLEKLKPTDIKNLPNEEKLATLKGAYRVTGQVAEKTIVLVDDLIRSGSTLGYISDLLRERGAKRVPGLAATKTLRD